MYRGAVMEEPRKPVPASHETFWRLADFYERRAESTADGIARSRENYRSSGAILVGAAGISASLQANASGWVAGSTFLLTMIAAGCGIAILWPRKITALKLDRVRDALEEGANTSEQASLDAVLASLETFKETVDEARDRLKWLAWLVRMGFGAMGLAVGVAATASMLEFVQGGC